MRPLFPVSAPSVPRAPSLVDSSKGRPARRASESRGLRAAVGCAPVSEQLRVERTLRIRRRQAVRANGSRLCFGRNQSNEHVSSLSPWELQGLTVALMAAFD